MKVYFDGNNYNFCNYSMFELRDLKENALEMELLDQESHKSIGKRLSLEVGNVSGDARLDFEPKEANWENVEKVKVTLSEYFYRILMGKRSGRASADYWDLFFLEEDID